MTQVSIIWDVWDPLGLRLNQKDLKSGKKRLSYGQFTTGRLRDSSKYHTGNMGSIRASLASLYIQSRMFQANTERSFFFFTTQH